MKSVCIYGCAKNVESYLPKVFKNIDILRSVFDVKGIYIGYDESSDKTIEIINKYNEKTGDIRICKSDIQLDSDTVIDSYGNTNSINFVKEQDSKERCINISNARNRCLKAIRDSNINPELIIAMDFDDVCNEEMDVSVIKKYLKRIDEWDGLTFYNERYYDFWALSIVPFTLSCLHNNNNKRVIKAMSCYLRKKHLQSNGMIYCNSAFNGFAIYKYDKYGSNNYSVIHENRFHRLIDKQQVEREGKCQYYIHNISLGYQIDCEHRSFHYNATINNGAKLFMATQPLFPPYQGGHCGFLYDN